MHYYCMVAYVDENADYIVHMNVSAVTFYYLVLQVKGTFDGVEAPTFSYLNSIITPGQKGFFGMWTMHDTSDLLVTYHYGTLSKVRRCERVYLSHGVLQRRLARC